MRGAMAMSLLLLAALGTGCSVTPLEGSGTAATESRDVRDLHGVSLSIMGELHVRQTGEESLSITADDNLLPYIETEVRDGQLEIRLSRSCPARSISPVSPIRYELTVKELNAVAMSGPGGVTVDALESDTLAVAVSGAGDVTVGRLETDRVDVAMSGAGDVELSGSARTQAIAVSGSGEYRGDDLRSEKAAAAVSGAGDVTVWAEVSLDVGVSGAGSVAYYGSPTVEQRVSGSGFVKSLGSKGTSL